MTSDRQRAANRANSAKSTGPRTKAGKSAASLNARLHGLATAVQSEPGADAEIERMARAIADEAGRPDLIELARRIAEAEVDLRRIRRARVTLAKLPAVMSTSFRMVPSPNCEAVHEGAAYENQRKTEFVRRLGPSAAELGWDPNAPDSSRRREARRERTSSSTRSSVTSAARRRDANRRSASLTP